MKKSELKAIIRECIEELDEAKEYGYTKDGILQYKGYSAKIKDLMKMDKKSEPNAKYKKVEGEDLPKPGNKYPK